MLTPGERTVTLAGGGLFLAGIGLFVALSVAALAGFGMPSGAAFLRDPYILSVMRFTLYQALLSTLISIAFAIPVARALSRQRRFPGRIWAIRLMAVPMGLPVLIGALGLIGIWGRHGLVNDALSWLGLSAPVSIYGLPGILLAHVFFNMPLACRLLLIGLDRIPGEYWQMSAGLGMRSTTIFRLIEWPVIRRLLPGIAGLIFMLCATSFTLVLTLGGGPAATTIEVAIYQALRFDFDPGRAVGLSLLQIAVTAVILIAMALFPAPDDHGQTEGRSVRRLDADAVGARLFDTLWLGAALMLTALPLVMIMVSGLRADLTGLLTDPLFVRAFATSLALSLASGLLSLLCAMLVVTARSALADTRHPGLVGHLFSATLSASSSLVLLVPPVVIATGWFLLLLPLGEVARFAPALVIGINAVMALPFVMRVLAPAFQIHRQRTGRLAASLGLSGLPRLRRVDWPGLRKPLAMAMSFAMALSLGDLGAVAVFGSDTLVTLPWLLYSRLGSYRTSDADGLAFILGIICLALTVAGTVGSTVEKERRS